MQYNKNGILVQTPGKRQKRKKPNFHLPMRTFKSTDKHIDVEIVVPQFSPVLELLERDGWREVKGG